MKSAKILIAEFARKQPGGGDAEVVLLSAWSARLGMRVAGYPRAEAIDDEHARVAVSGRPEHCSPERPPQRFRDAELADLVLAEGRDSDHMRSSVEPLA